MSHWKRIQKTISTGRKDQATMVVGINVKVRSPIRMAKDGGEVFEKACELAGVQKTVRQHNKFNRGVGAAYAKRYEAATALSSEVQADA